MIHCGEYSRTTGMVELFLLSFCNAQDEMSMIHCGEYSRTTGMVESFEMDRKPNICCCVVVVVAADVFVPNSVAVFHFVGGNRRQ